MTIERSDKELIIKVPSNVDIEGVQQIIDYIRYKEVLSKSKATDEDIEKLSEELNQSWWDANKEKFDL